MIRPMPRFAIMLAGLLLALPVVGSSPRQAPHAPPVPLLWKVSDADSSVYLLGSFHLLAKSDYPLSADVDRAFERSTALVFEVAPDDLDDPGVTARMLALASSDPASTVARVVPADLKASLDARLVALGLPPDRMAAYEPWFVDTVMVTQLGQRAGYAPEDGLDRALMARAKASGKPVSGLETVADQLATLDGIPVAEQVASLRDFLQEGDSAQAKLDELHDAWRRGDAVVLERLTRTDMRDLTPITYQRLDVDRNRAWVPQLERMLARGRGGDVLAVVGALHLLGDDGLVELLRARGYRVERICTGCAAPSR